MATKYIFVRPARPDVLVPYEGHRAGHYIGVRHAKKDDADSTIVLSVDGGHSYVADPTPAKVPQTAYYLRQIEHGDLVEVADPASAPAPKGGKS